MASFSDCITLDDSDDDLEILDEQITNYGCALTEPKQLELSKDMEETILESLRKQNVSIPKGNFKLKIFAKNGGNVDLNTLDLSSISNCSLSVKNKEPSQSTALRVSATSKHRQFGKLINDCEEQRHEKSNRVKEFVEKPKPGSKKEEEFQKVKKIDHGQSQGIGKEWAISSKEKHLKSACTQNNSIDINVKKGDKESMKQKNIDGSTFKTRNSVSRDEKPEVPIKSNKRAHGDFEGHTSSSSDKVKRENEQVSKQQKLEENIDSGKQLKIVSVKYLEALEYVVDIIQVEEPLKSVKMPANMLSIKETQGTLKLQNALEDLVDIIQDKGLPKTVKMPTKKDEKTPAKKDEKTPAKQPTINESLETFETQDELKGLADIIQVEQLLKAVEIKAKKVPKESLETDEIPGNKFDEIEETAEISSFNVEILEEPLETVEMPTDLVDIIQDEDLLKSVDIISKKTEEPLKSWEITAKDLEETVEIPGSKVEILEEPVETVEMPNTTTKVSESVTNMLPVVSESTHPPEETLAHPGSPEEQLPDISEVDAGLETLLKEHIPGTFDKHCLSNFLSISDNYEKLSSNPSFFNNSKLKWVEIIELSPCDFFFEMTSGKDALDSKIDIDTKIIENETKEDDNFQVVPNLEDYIEKNMPTLNIGTQVRCFADIFSEVPPTDEFLKDTALNLFVHENVIPEAMLCANPLNMETEHMLIKHSENVDISGKFEELDTSTLLDIEEMIRESENEGENSFVSVEVLESILGENVNLNELFSILKEQAFKHFKFSGWKLTHVSIAVAKHITEIDLNAVIKKKKEEVKTKKDDNAQDTFNDLESLLCDEFTGLQDCFNKTLTELAEEQHDDKKAALEIPKDDTEASNEEIAELESRQTPSKTKSVRNSFVLVKNIPINSLQHAAIKSDILLNNSTSSSASPPPGPRDFLWQLDMEEFGELFGLCTHSQAAEIKAKSLAPIAKRLRRFRAGKDVNYRVEGRTSSSSTRKRRDQRRSI